MNIALLNPYVRYIDKRTAMPKYSDFVLAYDHRMIYTQKGSAEIFANNDVYTLNENNALIIPPSTPYKINPNSDFECFILNFDFTYDNTAPEPIVPVPAKLFQKNKIFSSVTSELFPFLLTCQSEVSAEMEEIFNAYIKKSTLYREFMSSELKRIIINSIIFTKQDKTPDLIKNIISYINQNIAADLTNLNIAQKFSYHPNYINRTFKNSTGKTIKAYITELRLSNAKRLLKTTGLSIYEISELCGFESYSYFIKKFRTVQGISPLKYRKQNSLRL